MWHVVSPGEVRGSWSIFLRAVLSLYHTYTIYLAHAILKTGSEAFFLFDPMEQEGEGGKKKKSNLFQAHSQAKTSPK